MHQLRVTIDLGAGEAGGKRLIWIARDALDPSIFDGSQQ
jgi:hypothetical protein